jgi:hypothetical protein
MTFFNVLLMQDGEDCLKLLSRAAWEAVCLCSFLSTINVVNYMMFALLCSWCFGFVLILVSIRDVCLISFHSNMYKILGEDKVMVDKLAPERLEVEYSLAPDLPQIAFRQLRQEWIDMGYGVPPESELPRRGLLPREGTY